jgi:hypothetical protein
VRRVCEFPGYAPGHFPLFPLPEGTDFSHEWLEDGRQVELWIDPTHATWWQHGGVDPP